MKAGDRVVCVDASSRLSEPPALKRGKAYTIEQIREFGCGCVGIDVGLLLDDNYVVCLHGIVHDNNGTRWCDIGRFRKLDEAFAERVLEEAKEELEEGPLVEVID